MNHYITDIGFVNFIFIFGYLGFLWLVLLISKSFLDLLSNPGNHLEIVGYFLLAFFTMPTLDFYIRPNFIFIFGVYIGLLSLVTKNEKNNIKTKDSTILA